MQSDDLSEKLDIAERARSLIPLLHAGINGVQFPDVAAECEEEWCEDYAILQNLYPDTWLVNEEYFDFDRLTEDYRALVKGHFAGDDTVVFGFYGDQELEIYRKKEDRP